MHLEKAPKTTYIILKYLFYKEWSSKYIQNPINFPGILMLFVSRWNFCVKYTAQ